MKKKRKITGTDVGIAMSVVGLLASLIVIVFSFIDGTSKATGVALFCACSACLSMNARNKRNEK